MRHGVGTTAGRCARIGRKSTQWFANRAIAELKAALLNGEPMMLEFRIGRAPFALKPNETSAVMTEQESRVGRPVAALLRVARQKLRLFGRYTYAWSKATTNKNKGDRFNLWGYVSAATDRRRSS